MSRDGGEARFFALFGHVLGFKGFQGVMRSAIEALLVEHGAMRVHFSFVAAPSAVHHPESL